MSIGGRGEKSITAYLRGGLGNQLFILATGMQQAHRLGCPLVLDRSHFAVANRRSYELYALGLGHLESFDGSPWLGLLPENRRRPFKESLRRGLRASRRPPVFHESGFG